MSRKRIPKSGMMPNEALPSSSRSMLLLKIPASDRKIEMRRVRSGASLPAIWSSRESWLTGARRALTWRAPIVRRFGFGISVGIGLGEGCGVGLASEKVCGVALGEGVGVAVGVCDTAVWIKINSKIAAKKAPFDFFKKIRLFDINFQEPRINKI